MTVAFFVIGGVLAVIGLIDVWVLVSESWGYGRLKKLRDNFREWLAWRPPTRPLRRLRFRLGVWLMRPRLDAMHLHYKRLHEADETNQFALHHVFAVRTLRDWRESLRNEDPQ